MKTKQQIAQDLFKQGYNCAQSVLGAFHNEIGLTFEDALRLSSSFGGGMGRMREVCGAVSSMFMIAGIKKGYITPNDDIVKEKHYALIQDLTNEFKGKYGTIICRELLGLDDTSPIPTKRTEEYYSQRPCEEFIKTCAELISKKL